MNQDNIKVLLTGATGSVGLEALKILNKNSRFSVKTFDRDNKSVKRILYRFSNVEKVYGRLENYDSILSACRDIDIVIHLGALIPPKADEEQELAWKTNVTGTSNIIDAMQKLNPGGKIIYASSISVYGDRLKDPWIKVTDAIKPSDGDYYAQTKIEAENLIRKSQLDWSILRVSAVMGIQTSMSSLFFHMPLDTSLEIITARDAGRAFVKAIDHFAAISHKTYNLAGGPLCRTSYKDFLARVFDIKGLKKPVFPEQAFANHNFHCGFYQDEAVLQDIIDFQSESLDDYYNILADQQNKFTLFITRIFSSLIKKAILQQSDPLKAFRKGSGILYHRFFNISSQIH